MKQSVRHLPGLFRMLPKVVGTLAVLAALGFGASEALAENPATTCPYYPPTENGECYSDMQCTTMCKQQPG